VNVERTVLEWTYDPQNLFEVPYGHSDAEVELVFDGGRALAILKTPTASVSADLEERVQMLVESILLVRQLQVHRTYSLSGPRIYQHAAGRKDVSIRLAGVVAFTSAGQMDVVARDAASNILHDSKAERIAQHVELLNVVSAKLARSPVLRGLLESYSRSVSDPADELVHLYEIRDRLSAHYGGEQAARNALQITKTRWQRLGLLANVEPLVQGRHRGEHCGGQRAATRAELEEARRLVREWIIAFARTV
jgi:hypothetical protein